MSASEVKEDSIQFVKEYVETIITKALNELHESESEPESTAPPLPKVDSNEPCKPIVDHKKLKTENSVEETTSNTESNSTELEQHKADTSTETADVGKESAKDFPEEDPPAEIGVTTKFFPDLPALTADGFETDKLKKTTGQSKERPENYNLNKPGQHGACNPTEENQKEVNKTPEKTESPKQVEDLHEASEKNVNWSIDQQTESSTKPGPIKRGTQSTEKLFVQTPQEEPGKNSNLENQTISKPTPESTVTNRLQQKLSFSRKDSASQTSKAVTTEFQISIYHIVLIIMSSTIA